MSRLPDKDLSKTKTNQYEDNEKDYSFPKSSSSFKFQHRNERDDYKDRHSYRQSSSYSYLPDNSYKTNSGYKYKDMERERERDYYEDLYKGRSRSRSKSFSGRSKYNERREKDYSKVSNPYNDYVSNQSRIRSNEYYDSYKQYKSGHYSHQNDYKYIGKEKDEYREYREYRDYKEKSREKESYHKEKEREKTREKDFDWEDNKEVKEVKENKEEKKNFPNFTNKEQVFNHNMSKLPNTYQERESNTSYSFSNIQTQQNYINSNHLMSKPEQSTSYSNSYPQVFTQQALTQQAFEAKQQINNSKFPSNINQNKEISIINSSEIPNNNNNTNSSLPFLSQNLEFKEKEKEKEEEGKQLLEASFLNMHSARFSKMKNEMKKVIKAFNESNYIEEIEKLRKVCVIDDENMKNNMNLIGIENYKAVPYIKTDTSEVILSKTTKNIERSTNKIKLLFKLQSIYIRNKYSKEKIYENQYNIDCLYKEIDTIQKRIDTFKN